MSLSYPTPLDRLKSLFHLDVPADPLAVAVERLVDRQRELSEARRNWSRVLGREFSRMTDRRACPWCVGSESHLSSASEWVWYEAAPAIPLAYVGGYHRVERGPYTFVFDASFEATVYVFTTALRRDELLGSARKPRDR